MEKKQMTTWLMMILCGLAIGVMPAVTNAALVVDQHGFGTGDAVNGGFSGTARQSFQPAANNLAGVDVFLYSVAKWIDGGPSIDYTANISFALYTATGAENFGYSANTPLTTGDFFLDTGTSREGWVVFRFGPMVVTPDSYYVLEFSTDNGVFGITTKNSYTRGQVLEPGLQRDYFDLHFITYTEDTFVPEPATVVLLALGSIAMMWYRKQ